MKTILLPIDLNHKSSWEMTIPQVVDLARLYGATVHVLTVIPDYGMSIVGSYFPKDFSQKAAERTQQELDKLIAAHFPEDIDVHAHVQHGQVYREVIDAASRLKADLIVMRSHRSEMKDYLLGPNAARVVRHAPQSVMVIR